jgi:mRNA-degrading endonuclease RelE of RelBE toxin-antitoxin system
MLEVEWSETAVNTLRSLEKEQVEEIRKKVREVSEQQFSHKYVKPIKDRGKWIWRLKVKEENTDHRIFMDLIEGNLVILEIAHRDNAYQR